MKIGTQTLDLERPAVMTIVNVTPDSFFVNSRSMHVEEITMRVEEAVGWGAKIIDIGGYSSRPGAAEVPVDEEVDRVMTGVEVVREKAPNVIISIDTFRAEVARRVIEKFGPCIINDISAGQIDPEIVDVAAQTGVPYVLMHSRGNPQTMQEMTDYQDIVREIKDFFAEKIAFLNGRGVEEIIIDPGFGFAKTTPQNFRLLGNLSELQKFGYPVLAGISRKSMIYNVLENSPVEALAGTASLNWACLQGGANILRVHDTLAAIEVVKLYNYYKNVNG